MANNDKHSLIQLGSSNLSLADMSQDVRGHKMIDARGHEIGHVDDLFIDEIEKKVRFVQVAAGGFLGLGETKFLVPVDVISRIDEDGVHIDRDRQHVASSPPYDPKLVDKPYLDDLYRYYGYAPFWTMGYSNPPFPFSV
jgi:sporulation protein YlmC with PRC-barrel domain